MLAMASDPSLWSGLCSLFHFAILNLQAGFKTLQHPTLLLTPGVYLPFKNPFFMISFSMQMKKLSKRALCQKWKWIKTPGFREICNWGLLSVCKAVSNPRPVSEPSREQSVC